MALQIAPPPPGVDEIQSLTANLLRLRRREHYVAAALTVLVLTSLWDRWTIRGLRDELRGLRKDRQQMADDWRRTVASEVAGEVRAALQDFAQRNGGARSEQRVENS